MAKDNAQDNQNKIRAAQTPKRERSPKQDATAATAPVSQNVDGEATNQTSKDGSTEKLDNKTSVPQNDQKGVETTPPDNETAKEADESRTEEEFGFADESNPNQKARNAAAPDQYDQDGNPRTGGYSYGVAPDDTEGTVPEKDNEGTAPQETQDVNVAHAEPMNTGDYLNQDVNAQEWSLDKQRDLEKSLSDPKQGIKARVTTSVGKYVTVLFFRNNKPMGSFESRNFKSSAARKHLDRLKKLA